MTWSISSQACLPFIYPFCYFPSPLSFAPSYPWRNAACSLNSLCPSSDGALPSATLTPLISPSRVSVSLPPVTSCFPSSRTHHTSTSRLSTSRLLYLTHESLRSLRREFLRALVMILFCISDPSDRW